jgi:hypothetical protein
MATPLVETRRRDVAKRPDDWKERFGFIEETR